MKRSELNLGDVISKRKKNAGHNWRVIELQEKQVIIHNEQMKRKIIVEDERLKFWDFVKGGKENV